jgi:hypothetical protein
VFAWDSDSVNLAAVEYDADSRKPYEDLGKSVQISENSTESVTLKVIKPAPEQ